MASVDTSRSNAFDNFLNRFNEQREAQVKFASLLNDARFRARDSDRLTALANDSFTNSAVNRTNTLERLTSDLLTADANRFNQFARLGLDARTADTADALNWQSYDTRSPAAIRARQIARDPRFGSAINSELERADVASAARTRTARISAALQAGDFDELARLTGRQGIKPGANGGLTITNPDGSTFSATAKDFIGHSFGQDPNQGLMDQFTKDYLTSARGQIAQIAQPAQPAVAGQPYVPSIGQEPAGGESDTDWKTMPAEDRGKRFPALSDLPTSPKRKARDMGYTFDPPVITALRALTGTIGEPDQLGQDVNARLGSWLNDFLQMSRRRP